jgi:hypothetical protein
MGDMIILPSQDILIINGAQQGKSSVWFLPFTLHNFVFSSSSSSNDDSWSSVNVRFFDGICCNFSHQP